MDFSTNRKGWTPPAVSFYEAVGHVSNYPLAYVHGLYLALAGDIIGRKAYIRYGMPIYPNQYICLVGDSAIHHKSTAVAVALETLGDRLRDHPPMTDISTSQGLLEELAGNGGKRFIYLDELASAMKRGKQDFAADVISKLVELYASPRSTGTHTRHNPIVVNDVFLSLVACSTVEWLRSSVTNTDLMAGFGNRMTFILGDPREEKAWPQNPWLEDYSWDRFDDFEGQIHLDEDALEVWKVYYAKYKKQQAKVSPFIHSLSARLPEKVLKACIVHCAWLDTHVLSADTLLSGIDWGNYLRECIMFLAPAFGQVEEQLLQLIKTGKIKNRQALFNALSHSHSARVLKDALSNLVWLGHVQDLKGSITLVVDTNR